MKKELLGKKVDKLNLFVYTILFNKMGKRKASDNAGSPNQDLCDFLIGKLFVIYSVYIYFINETIMENNKSRSFNYLIKVYFYLPLFITLEFVS